MFQRNNKIDFMEYILRENFFTARSINKPKMQMNNDNGFFQNY